mmetsp:Transcript_67146/g.118762  ORF Transcript_67146/g.118762 Transcript_67146/m.118762 type:complete len:104 (-) Transcript_67146:92-403(-)|eukprot:CAMPEP_0197652392 /NCGR_PEP_ID=MMETSP1338-20131121/34427_1 /TAXON_ID=43686 ORGANISM="Pelagodinium beii, Strain RCC1491" /NCGR_SAMPLE_ID=MMETSP1338 /ASSEMBLY_ACC=CAM_ASM_000754 /LENGTH=103 /DNA_ID=CAMNT_0043227263 /DNA_START=57 /DNA_END=368 /DNA_ORIENTATION=+
MASVKVDPTSLVIGVGIGAAVAFLVTKATMKPLPVNPSIEKSSPKVVTVKTVKEIEDMVAQSKGGKVALCRCWRSEKFPFCDGTHGKYNEACCDNTGPLVISK